MLIQVTGLRGLEEKCMMYHATHLISLLDPGEHVPFNEYLPEHKNRLLISCRDVIFPGTRAAPTEEQVREILEFGKELDEGASLVIHCLAGISRSTAAALALLVQEHGVDKIKECVDMLLDIRPQCYPNPIMIRYADKLLGADGALIAEVKILNNSALWTLMQDDDDDE